MKKILLFPLLILSVIVLTGCGSKDQDYIPENIGETFIEETVNEDINEQEEAPVEDEIQENENTEIIENNEINEDEQ